MRFLRRTWIRGKTTGLSVILICTVLLIVGIAFGFLQVHFIRQVVMQQHTQLAQQVMASHTGPDEQNSDFLNRILPTTPVQSAFVLDDQGAVMTENGIGLQSYFASMAVSSRLALPAINSHFDFSSGSYIVETVQVLTYEQEAVRYLYLYSRLNRHSIYVRTLINVWATLGVLTAIGLLALLWMRWLMVQPLSALIEMVRTMSLQPSEASRLNYSTQNKVGMLAHELNCMLDVLQEKEQLLTQDRDGLEREIEQRTREMRQKHDEALASAKAKSEFLANMSHEIRTPMNGVIGMLSLLEEAELDDENRDYLVTAHNSARALLSLIDDILDFSKIESGKVDFEVIPFNLRALVEEVTTLFTEAAAQKSLNLACFIPNHIPEHVQGDPTRLRQVLVNLVSNAVKFTDEGEILVRVTETDNQEDASILHFSVKDTGIGIPEDRIDRLFKPFTQADGSTTRKYGGTGLGLSISKKLVALMGGTIGVSSQLDKGSEFWFDLDLPSELPVETIPAVVAPGFQHLRVLIVDSNPTNSLILKHYLEPQLNRPVVCYDAFDAINTLCDAQHQGCPFDLLLLDYDLPGWNALEFARQIQTDKRFPPPYTVLLTAVALQDDSANQNGITIQLLRPFRRDQLYNALMTCVHLSESDGKTAAVPSAPDMLQGNILVVDDDAINRKVALSILNKIGLKAEVAHDGQQAFERSAEQHYDLILMDCQMPVMSGFEASEAIRRRELAEDRAPVTIVAMTANTMEDVQEHCLSVGMNDYLSKPVDKDAVVACLSKWLHAGTVPAEQNDIQSYEVEVVNTVKSVTHDPVWDRENALARLAGDEDLLAEMMRLFAERAPSLLDRIQNAVQQKDCAALRDNAHALKGAVSYFSASTITDLLVQLENAGKACELTDIEEQCQQLEVQVRHLLSSFHEMDCET